MPKQRRQQIQRQVKREQREQKSRSEFIRSPTAQKAKRTARAQANVVYKPVLRGLKSEAAGSKKREGEISSWYGGLNAQNAAAQSSAASTSAAQESALTQRLAQAGSEDSSALAAQASKNAELAKQLGGPTNTAGQAEAAKGAQAVAQQRVALTSPLSAERASYQNYLGQRGISATERGIEAHKAETSRRRKIKEDLRAGKRERGQAVVANLEKLREGARDYAIQKQAFGQKGKELAVGSKEAAIDRAQKAREGAASRRISAESAGSTRISAEASARSATTGEKKLRKEGKGGGLTQSERNSRREGHQNAMVTVKRAIKLVGVPTTAKDWANLEAAVASEDGVNATQAAQAVRRYKERIKPQRQRQAVVKAIPSGF